MVVRGIVLTGGNDVVPIYRLAAHLDKFGALAILRIEGETALGGVR